MAQTHIYKMSAYPKEIVLRDGTQVILTPMMSADAGPLLDFFRRIPAADLYFLKEDVLDAAVINRWAAEINFDRTLPVLAWSGGRIVGDGTLHRTRAAARRHVAQIRIVVDPAFRMRGLGTTMLHEMASIANDNGVERLLLEAVVDKEEQAIKAAEFAGFVKVGILPGHVKDPDGHPRDVVLLEMPLGKWLEWWVPATSTVGQVS